MRRKISPWSRVSTDKPNERTEIFQPKRINSPFHKAHEEIKDKGTEEIKVKQGEEKNKEREINDEEVLELLRNRRQGKKSKKRRGNSISVCVSDEEEAILRSAAAASELSFSEWSRRAMFKEAGVKIPKR